MHIILKKFESIKLNRKIFTEDDVRRLCRVERVKILELPMLIPGWYGKLHDRGHIYIDYRLKGLRWLHVALHELAHHYLHAASYSNAAFFFCDRDECRPSKEHFEAEAFALLALLPKSHLGVILATPADELEDYLKVILPRRLRLLELYGE